MDRDLWRRVKRIAADALAQPDVERAAFVADQCGIDEGLRREVESLIQSAVLATPLYETPALVVAEAAAVESLFGREPVAPGARVGPHRIVRELGRGGMGTVYLAERQDGEFDQRVAIKVVGWNLRSPLLLDRFRQERRILASLEHANIARLLDGGTTADGTPYVVLEYVEGLPIDEFCDAQALTVRDRIELFRTVCHAVHYAHQRLIIHRDIKAGNILMSADGTPKLLDFGIAKLLDPSAEDDAVGQTIVRALTLSSASPEQVRGERITIATDIYALGVLLYRLLTGGGPYGEAVRTEAELARSICETTPMAPSAASRATNGGERSIGRDLDMIVLKALRKDPDRRYSTALELSDDLERYLQGRPVLAAPDTAAYRTAKFVRRHRTLVGGSLILLVAIVGGAGAAFWQARVARRERAAAQERFEMVRRLADSMVFDVNSTLEKVPGALEARRLVVSKALDYLGQLSRSVGNDKALAGELGAAYYRIGDIQGNPAHSNIGDVKGAMASFQQSRRFYEQLDQAGSTIASRRGRADALGGIALMHWTNGEFDAALANYEQARVILESLVRTDGGNADLSRGLGSVQYWIGQTYLRRGETDRALARYQQSVQIYLAVLEAHPDDVDARERLAVSYMKLGDVADVRGDWAQAVRHYADVVAMLERLVEHANVSQTTPRLLALGRVRMAEELVLIKRYADAEGYARRAIADFQRTLALSPSDLQARYDDAYAHFALGKALAPQQRDGDALEAFEHASASYRAGLAANPQYIEDRRELGITLCRIGDLMLRRRLPHAALKSYVEAAPLLEAPDIRPQVVDTLALMYLRMGDAHVAVGGPQGTDRREAAVFSYKKSETAWAELASQHPLAADQLTLQRETAAKASGRR
jgi:tetratricopeptide (TPR) repeat protein/tRNA A-37 threonylcarbamoyl transferase component Bud32